MPPDPMSSWIGSRLRLYERAVGCLARDSRQTQVTREIRFACHRTGRAAESQDAREHFSGVVMMRMGGITWAMVVLVAASVEGVGAQSFARDSTQIAAASRSFSQAYVRGDTAAIRALYTEDAVLLPPGREVRGLDGIAQYFAPSPNRVNITHRMESSELRLRGDVAIDIGTWHNTWRIGDAPERSASDWYLVVWRRGDDGRWRIEYDMWH